MGSLMSAILRAPATTALSGYTTCTSYSPIQSPQISHLGTAPRAAFSRQLSLSSMAPTKSPSRPWAQVACLGQLSATRDHCPHPLLDSQLPHTSH